MIPCQTVSNEAWDWLLQASAHPLDAELRDHLAGCAACSLQVEEIGRLRAGLGSLAEVAPTGFEGSLQQRLEHLRTTGVDPQAGRFEEDPFLAEAAPPEALLVERRSPLWWRPLALVATGAAAVLVLGLVTRWSGQSPAGLPVESAARLAEPTPVVDSLLAPGVDPAADPAQTGLLAERPYDEPDSSRDAARRPEAREKLTPVTVTP
ncbi:MAG: hypothetical protein WC326_07250 [Candidatus Delongbacteria bacterium]